MPGISDIPSGEAWKTINTMVGGRCIQGKSIIHLQYYYSFHMRLDPGIVVYKAIEPDMQDWLLVRRIGPPKVCTVVVEPADDMGMVIIKCYSLAGGIEFHYDFEPWEKIYGWLISSVIRRDHVLKGSMTNQQKVKIIFPDGTLAEWNTLVKPELRQIWIPVRRLRSKTAPYSTPGLTSWCPVPQAPREMVRWQPES